MSHLLAWISLLLWEAPVMATVRDLSHAALLACSTLVLVIRHSLVFATH